ncbi:MAG: hypothetical protein HRT43_05940 [Campylobacteraceae bacterium]|nr:hypothetical protein [Campylobacteraceae bacterium]
MRYVVILLVIVFFVGCSKTSHELKKGEPSYSLGEEELQKEIESNKPKKTKYDTRVEKLWINPIDTIFSKNPEICGRMTIGAAWRPIFVTIIKDKKTYGPYWADPNIWDKEWCVKVTDDLESGEYEAKVEIIK